MPRRRKVPHVGTRWIIGYARKSTDTEDKQVHSLDDQETLIRTHFTRLDPHEQQLHPLKIMREAVSAYHPGRPVFNEIMAMADEGKVHGIIAVHPNRISRNHADSGGFTQRLVDKTILFLEVAGGKRYTAENSNDIFMLNLEGAMSWKDSRDKGDRILQAMHLRAAEGKHMGPVRLGYRGVYQPDGSKKLEPVPADAAVIRRLFELAAAGAHSVNDLFLEAKRLGLRSRSGKVVPRAAIHMILHDPLYKGYIRFDGVLAKGLHEPIVPEPLWDSVEAVLGRRRTSTSRPKDPELRESFVFGNLLRCPRCRRTLIPYRVKGQYIYYECKNPDTDCGVCVPQPILAEQLPSLLAGFILDAAAREDLRRQLLGLHEKRSQDGESSGESLQKEYGQVMKEIGDVFAQRSAAQAMGVLDAVDQRLNELRLRKEALQARLETAKDRGTGWIDDVIRSFELIELLQEAIFYGSRRSREPALIGVASNYTVDGKKLIAEPRSPFQECARRGVIQEWYSSLDDVRTEIAATCGMLRTAFSAFDRRA